MSEYQRVVTVLGEFSSDCGLPRIALDANNRTRLSIGEVPVSFIYENEPVDMLWLYAELGEIPEASPKALEFLLQIGLGSWVTGSMTLGLDQDDTTVLGYTVIPAAMLDLARLRDTLERLLTVALPVRDRIKKGDFRLDLPETVFGRQETPGMAV